MSEANQLAQSKDPYTQDASPPLQGIFTALSRGKWGELLCGSEFGSAARDPSTATCRSLSERQSPLRMTVLK